MYFSKVRSVVCVVLTIITFKVMLFFRVIYIISVCTFRVTLVFVNLIKLY